MFPGSSSILGRSDETRHRSESDSTLRVTAAPVAALSEGRAAFGDRLRRRPKLFADLHKGAVDGCLGRNAQFVDDEKKLPLCQYRIERNRFLAVLADFGAIARTSSVRGAGRSRTDYSRQLITILAEWLAQAQPGMISICSLGMPNAQGRRFISWPRRLVAPRSKQRLRANRLGRLIGGLLNPKDKRPRNVGCP